jgi:hypothetical protein
MGGLAQSVLDRMKSKAQAIKEKQAAAQGSQKAPRWELTGKNAIVAPGHEVIIRLLPRWDFSHKYMRQGDKIVLNPKYVEDLMYFEALEHWWDTDDGKGGTRPQREWCLKTFDKNLPCPFCEVSDELISSANIEDRKAGKRMASREVYLFNAVVGSFGKRKMTEAGKPDIRILPLQESLLVQLSNIMTGGDSEGGEEAFVRGDVSDIKEGYNLKLMRPAAQGDRWKMDCSPKASPLYGPEEREAWKTWVTQLINIPEVVKEEMLSYEAAYKAFHGVSPEEMKGEDTREAKPQAKPTAKPAKMAAPAVDGDEFESSVAGTLAPEEPDLGFELPEEPSEVPTPGKKPGKK